MRSSVLVCTFAAAMLALAGQAVAAEASATTPSTQHATKSAAHAAKHHERKHEKKAHHHSKMAKTAVKAKSSTSK